MSHFRHKDRAIALVTTLTALVVVIMLVGAFFINWQSHIAMSRYSAEKKACAQALSSLADACRFQLEGKRDWGKVAGAEDDAMEFNSGPGSPLLALRPVAADAPRGEDFAGMWGLAYFEGESARTDVKIALSIVNNLDNELPLSARRVGAKSCRLQIRVRKGSYSEWVEVTLRRAGFFDSTVLANKKIEIVADTVKFSSADPLRNQIRSESEIYLPDTLLLEFEPADDNLTAETGTVWSKEDIHIGGIKDPAKLLEAAEHTGADFLPNAPSYYRIPELRKSDVDYETGKPVIHIAPANYVFEKNLAVKYSDTRGRTYNRTVSAVLVYGAGDSPVLGEFHFLADQLMIPDEEDTEPEEYVPQLNTVVYDEVTGIAEPEPEFGLDSFICDMSTNSLSLDAVPEYRVAGDLSISGGDLVFVDEVADPDNPVEGFLSVERDFGITGQISNGGKIVAGRNVSLSPHDVRLDKRDKTSDIAIFAGKDVLISPPYSSDPGMRQDSHRYFVFKGLVYAGNDFRFLSSVEQGGTTYQFDRKLYIEGAVVAKGGEVLIRGSETVELKYNREFLDDLLENPQDRDVVQLEVLAWRPL